MDLGLQGRRAFVAGSSSGIGSGIARKLGSEGVEVIVHGRDAKSAEAVVAEIRADGGKAISILGRLDDMQDVERLARDALATGPIDILINSAGACPDVHPWFEVPIDNWHRQYQLSTVYAVQLIRAFVPPMRERGWGRVLNFGSVGALQPLTNHPDYLAAKLALHSVTTSLARELGNCGVTVNILVSGLVMTENTKAAFRRFGAAGGVPENDPEWERRVLQLIGATIPLDRGAELDEMAAAACFLVSEPAAYIHGASLRVDGGGSGFPI